MFTNEKLNIKQMLWLKIQVKILCFSKKCESSWKKSAIFGSQWTATLDQSLVLVKWRHRLTTQLVSIVSFLTHIFSQLDSHFFGLKKISKFWLMFIVPLFANYFFVHENIFCKSRIIFRFAFNVFYNNIFDLHIMFSTCL